MSRTSSAVCLMSGSMASSSALVCSATAKLLADSAEISAAAAWLCSASLRTSVATTAKPLPCSPARAASTAAFSARRSVFCAISPMTVTLVAIFFIAMIVSPTASPPALALVADRWAMASVCAAWSAFCRMLASISSMLDDSASAAAACWVAPAAIWLDESDSAPLRVVTCSAAPSTSLITVRSRPTMPTIAA